MTGRCLGVGRRYWPRVSTVTSWARRSSMAWQTSSRRSPRPSMMPLLVATLPSTMALAFFSTVRLRWYWARDRTSGVRRSTVSRLWLKMWGRASMHQFERPIAVVEVRDQHLDDGVRDWRRARPGWFVGNGRRRHRARSSRATAVMTTWRSFMPAGGLGDALRFIGFERVGFGGFDRAEAAGAGAFFPGDHEGGGAMAPAFPTVRALGLLADGDQLEVGDEGLGGPERRVVGQSHLDPRRASCRGGGRDRGSVWCHRCSSRGTYGRNRVGESANIPGVPESAGRWP